MVNLENFLKTWSLRSNSVTRQVNFNRTKIGGKCQNSNETFWVIFKHCEWGSWMNQWQNATRLKGCVIILRFLPVNRKIQFFLNVICVAFCHIFFLTYFPDDNFNYHTIICLQSIIHHLFFIFFHNWEIIFTDLEKWLCCAIKQIKDFTGRSGFADWKYTKAHCAKNLKINSDEN